LGKCLPGGARDRRLINRKYGPEADEEIDHLREQVRALTDANLALRREVASVRDRAGTGYSNHTEDHEDMKRSYSKDTHLTAGVLVTRPSHRSSHGSEATDGVDPSQVHIHRLARRPSTREEDDDENLLGEDGELDPVSPTFSSDIPRTKSSQHLTDNVKKKDIASSGINSSSAKSSALGKSRPVQFLIFLLAFSFVVFVLIASSTSLGPISQFLYGDDLPAMIAAKEHGAHGDDAHHDEGGSHAASEHDSGEHTDGHTDTHAGEDHVAATTTYNTEWAAVEVDTSDGVSHDSSHDSSQDSSHDSSHDTSHDSGHGHGRRLHRVHGRRLSGEVSELLSNIAFCLTSCGFVAFFVGVLKQPLILGYLLGGVLVGPNLGLDLVHSHDNVAEIANLGLVFLLFMIGLELDVKEILRMGRVVLLTGFFQFPVCFGAQYLIFSGLGLLGLSFGTGEYANMYVALVCAISSTMIVVKLLSEKGETDRPNGRLTVGILIFQDIWAMVFLAIQPNLAKPDLLTLCKQFGMIAALIVLALTYAKFVMPAILFFASRSVELMLVLSLSWCFFMGVTANLPWVGVGMELAALIAGVALATFPYSAEFNGKIKYIRDFFITLFFASLGMQIPMPSVLPIATAILIAFLVMVLRWVGIFTLVYMLGGTARLGILATLNLSQISEFALVICSLGINKGHIDVSTLEIIIWVFMILSVLSSNIINYNHEIFRIMAWLSRKVSTKGIDDANEEQTHEDERDILLLGFHRIASMLVAEFEHHNPQLLKKLQVVEFNQAIKEPLLRRGIKFTYGDFSSADVLEHCFHGEPKIIISTTPDTMLQGTTNMRILQVVQGVWPKAHVIVTADNPRQAAELYECGAHYVLRSAKLCAERLFELLNKYETDAGMSDLKRRFDRYKRRENDERRSFVGVGV